MSCTTPWAAWRATRATSLCVCGSASPTPPRRATRAACSGGCRPGLRRALVPGLAVQAASGVRHPPALSTALRRPVLSLAWCVRQVAGFSH